MKALYGARDAARADFARAEKDSQNSHLKNRYASLDAMIVATDKALRAHGLTVGQKVGTFDGILALRTTLMHLESGECESCDVPLLSDTSTKVNPMQALGSAISYARRFGYETILGVLREDDDGEGAYPRHREQAAPPQQYRQPAPARPAPPPAVNAPRPIATFDAWLDGAVKALGLEGEAGLWQTVNHLHRRMVEAGAAVAAKTNGERVARLKAHYGTEGGRKWLRDECRAYRDELARRATVPPDEQADPDDDELGSRE